MPRIARWFLDIILDNETLHWWSGNVPVSMGGNVYEGLGSRWTTPESLKLKSSLKSEKVELEFDSARQTNNADPIGHLLDQKWRRRQVRLRRLVWDAGQSPDAGTVLVDSRGRIRNLADELQVGKPAKLTMEIESGVLAYLERRRETRSPASQKRVFPDDLGFDLIAKLEGKTLRWRTKETKAGTVQIKLQDKYEPAPRQLALGRFETSGSFVAAFVGGQQDKRLIRVYAIADHQISKLDKIWINGDPVRDAALSHGLKTRLPVEGDNGEHRCWATFYDGRTDQDADSYLVSLNVGWTAAHRLRGVSYIIFEHEWDSDVAENFDYRMSGEGALLYDRRQDSTSGGSGSQRWDDPNTWAYSANAKVAADHYRSGIRIMSGSNALWFGVGEAVDAVPYSEFEMLADHCDDDIALKAGGTEKRYEVNGILSADKSHDDNLQRLADQMAARVVMQSGRISFRPPIVRAPVVTLTDGDLARGSVSKIDPGGRIDDMINTIDGQFINPANDFKKDDFPAVQVAEYVEDDNGEISDSLDLDLETSGERSQRIGKLKIEDSRRILEQQETYTTKARDIEPGEWFLRQSDLRGFPDGKMFIADDVEKFIDGSVEVKASEVYPDELVWVKETAKDIDPPPPFMGGGSADIPVPDITAEPVAVSAGDVVLPAVRLAHAGYQDFIGDEIIVELGFSNGLEGEDLGPAGPKQFAKIPGNQPEVDAFVGMPPSTTFVIRFRTRSGERHSLWSAYQEFTSTSVYRIGEASSVGGRSAEEVLEGIDGNASNLAREMLLTAAWRSSQEALMWIGGETVGAVAQRAVEVNNDSALSLSLLGTRNETDTAFILDSAGVVVPASGEPGSSAISLQALRTQHDNSRADIALLFESVDGQSAKATLTTDVNGFVTGFQIINEGNPVTSGFYVIASNFAVVDPGNGVNAPFYPFAVSGGVVYMRNVVVDTVEANSITTEMLVDNSISDAEILQSVNGPWVLSGSATSEAVNPPHGTGFSTIFDDDYPMQGGWLSVDISYFHQLSGGSYCAVYTQILVDGVVKDSRYHMLHPLFGSVQQWSYGLSGLAAGTRNIQVRVRANRSSSGSGGTGGDNVTVHWCKVTLEEMKK